MVREWKVVGEPETKIQGEQDPRMVAKRQRGQEVKEPVVEWIGSNQNAGGRKT